MKATTGKDADPFYNQKLKKIHVAVRQLCMSDEAYRDMLQNVIGRRSLKDAPPSLLDVVLIHLKKLGFKPVRRTSKTKTSGLIRALWKESSREKTDESLLAFIRTCLKLPENVTKDPDFLTKEDADKILGAMRAMFSEARKQAVKRGTGQ